MPNVTSELRNSQRISRVAWMYAGELEGTTDASGVIEYDFSNLVGKPLLVHVGPAIDAGGNRYMCTYDRDTNEITVSSLADGSLSDNDEITMTFHVIGTKGRTIDA